MKKIYIYDTTLRDGAQREGISLSVEDKLKITKKLDEFGFHYIEGGWPGSNPKDEEYFSRLQEIDLKESKVVAFGSTRRVKVKAARDENLKAILGAKVPYACIVGKSWDFHVHHILRTTPDENLRMIKESVSYLKKYLDEVIYDAEHFFDGYKSNPDYALKTLESAVEGGADCLVLCDTNGGTLPWEISKIFKAVKKRIKNVPLGIHAHNDAGCAVANTLMAVNEGALHIQGTINGYGERCGNTDLCAVIPALTLKLNLDCLEKDKIKYLTELSRFVSEVANIVPDPHQPYVGQSAFAHKGGVHVSAVTRKEEAYHHINPELVGNEPRIVISELAGKGAIVEKARQIGIKLSKKEAEEILQKLKSRESEGYSFEVADASLELFLDQILGKRPAFFHLESFLVTSSKQESGKSEASAIVKVRVKNKRHVAGADGAGPVDALDNALRRAISKFYPSLKDIKLTDYKVRVLSTEKGTAASIRVLVESTDGKRTWGTIGVSDNIIEASWEALVESIEYGLIHSRKG